MQIFKKLLISVTSWDHFRILIISFKWGVVKGMYNSLESISRFNVAYPPSFENLFKWHALNFYLFKNKVLEFNWVQFLRRWNIPFLMISFFLKFKRMNLEILMHYVTLQIHIFGGKWRSERWLRIWSRYICDLIVRVERKMLILNILRVLDQSSIIIMICSVIFFVLLSSSQNFNVWNNLHFQFLFAFLF